MLELCSTLHEPSLLVRNNTCPMVVALSQSYFNLKDSIAFNLI